jgi:hypothetical protein
LRVYNKEFEKCEKDLEKFNKTYKHLFDPNKQIKIFEKKPISDKDEEEEEEGSNKCLYVLLNFSKSFSHFSNSLL